MTLVQQLVDALKGMMEIAEMAMPDSYFQEDSRVNKAREALARADIQGGKELT